MTNLNDHGILSAAELPFYSISLLVSIGICIKHRNFTRNAGWFYLILLSLLRIIGSSCILYMETQNDYSASLQETAAITSAVGTAPLLLILMGLLERVHAEMAQRAFSQNIFRPIHLIALVALILAIVGGVDQSNSDPDTQSTGKSCMEAAGIIFVLIFLALAIIAVLTALRMSYIPTTEKKLVIAGTCVLPFVLVRVLYSVIVGFSGPGSAFYSRSVNVWVQAFMQFLMEVIAMAFYIWAGMFTPRQAPKSKDQSGTAAPRTRFGAADEETGLRNQLNSAPSSQKRSLGDYRPSRLVMNAVRDRN